MNVSAHLASDEAQGSDRLNVVRTCLRRARGRRIVYRERTLFTVITANHLHFDHSVGLANPFTFELELHPGSLSRIVIVAILAAPSVPAGALVREI